MFDITLEAERLGSEVVPLSHLHSVRPARTTLGSDSSAQADVPALADVLHQRSIRPGMTIAVSGSPYLALSAAALLSPANSWTAIVGFADLNPESAQEAGLDLTHLALVPRPGKKWLEVVATLVAGFELVLLKPADVPRDVDISRLSSRLRKHGTTLLAFGDWPRADVRFGALHTEWDGLGQGHGYLMQRHIQIETTIKRSNQRASVGVISA